MFLRESLLHIKAVFIQLNIQKKTLILLQFIILVSYFNICSNVIYFCDQICIFSIILQRHTIFRNHNNMLIYYGCLLFLGPVIFYSLINKKLQKTAFI